MYVRIPRFVLYKNKHGMEEEVEETSPEGYFLLLLYEKWFITIDTGGGVGAEKLDCIYKFLCM